MNAHQFPASRTAESVLATNKVLRNTYLLLSITLLFSAVTAALSLAVNTSFMVSLACSFGAMALIWFVLPRTAESAAGIGVVFAITG